ncbi:MAG: hypothetical protein ACOCUH_02125 [Bacteriovoracia bacterium]
MRLKLIVIILTLVLAPFASAQENEFSLSIDIGLRGTKVESDLDDDDSEDPEDALDFSAVGPSLSTAFTYRWSDWEAGVRSNMIAGIIGQLKQKAQGSTITGRYWYRGISLGPVVKYFSGYTPYKNWEIYVMAGPQYGVVTTEHFDDVNVKGGSFNKNHRLKYEGAGGMLALGITRSSKKLTQQIYYELSYKFLSFDTVTVVSDSLTDTDVITEEYLDYDLEEHSISLNIGFVLF